MPEDKFKVVTGEVRLSYCHLNEPQPRQDGDPRYGATLLIPKTDVTTKAAIDAAMRAAYEDGVQKLWGGARPTMKNALIYDGDGFRTDGSKFGPECAGHWVISGSSKNKPSVLFRSDPTDPNAFSNVEPQDIYSGMYGCASIRFYPFNSHGNRGVGCGLNAILKTRDGEPLSGGGNGASDFGGYMANTADFTRQAQPQAAPPIYQQPQAPVYQPQVSPVYAYPQGNPPAPVQPQVDPITGQPINQVFQPGEEDLPFT